MPELLITAPRVVTGTSEPAVLEPGYVLIADGRVAEAAGGPPPRDPDLALGTGYLVPGLIDLQVNGFFGVDLAEVDAAGWARVARRLPETGTTAFLPTLVTAPLGELAGALRSAAAIVSDPPAGARVLGVHLEGPFLSPSRPASHPPAGAPGPGRPRPPLPPGHRAGTGPAACPRPRPHRLPGRSGPAQQQRRERTRPG